MYELGNCRAIYFICFCFVYHEALKSSENCFSHCLISYRTMDFLNSAAEST